LAADIIDGRHDMAAFDQAEPAHSPALGVAAPIGIFVVLLLLGLSPAGRLLNYTFTPAMTAMGLMLLYLRPGNYLAFAMWVWMLTPFYRRLADVHGGYSEASLVMLAPIVVTACSAVGLVSNLRQGSTRAIWPYIGLIGVLIYGFFVGAVQNGLLASVLALLNWGLPILFAIHLLVLPIDDREKARQIMLAMVWGGVVIGAYGLIQYLILPAWDAEWMRGSALQSIGSPIPRMVRVFSTLNSPGPYAQFVAASSLIAVATQSRMRWGSLVLSLVGLLLSLVRAAWGSWALALVMLFVWSNVRQKVVFATTALAAILVITPAIAFSPLGETINARFATLSDTSSDTSYLERVDLYRRFSSTALSSIAGVGLGRTGVISARLSGQSPDAVDSTNNIDSGVLEIFYTFGVLGAVFLVMFGSIYVTSWPDRRNPYGVAAMVVAISCAPLVFFGNPLTGASGMLLYPFVALARLNRRVADDE
jgi:hypothetical protein